MRRLLLLSLLTSLLVACGQIGPLYLPEEEATLVPPMAESAEVQADAPAEAEAPAPVEAQ